MSEPVREVPIQDPPPALLAEDGDDVRALADAGAEGEGGPDVRPEPQVLHGLAEGVVPQLRSGVSDALHDDLPDTPTDQSEVVGCLVVVVLAVCALVTG